MNQYIIHYTLHLADNALMMGHRLSEWTGHGPTLELDIAASNIALDYLGQCRNLYQYAAKLINEQGLQQDFPSGSAGDIDEDDLAYLRTEREFRNHLLVEQPNGDWAQTMLKICFFSVFQKALYGQLQHSSDATLQAIATKSLKEVNYHVRWSSEWVVRLGDGTTESHVRMKAALQELWMFTGELFEKPSYAGELANYETIKNCWEAEISAIMEKAAMPAMPGDSWQGARGGLNGMHTEYMGYILAEMQYLQRTYPGAEW